MFNTLFIKLVRKISKAATPVFFSQKQASKGSELRLLNNKICSYMKSGLVREARDLFDNMPQRNVVTWNTMIRGFLLNGEFDAALGLFQGMPARDLFSYNTMISGLFQFGDVCGARDVFDGMMCRDIVTWNSMITGYVRSGLMDEAMKMFDEMPVKDVFSWNSVIGGHVNSGRLDLAEVKFRLMSERDVASWTIMISGFAKAGKIDEACKLYQEMPLKDVRACNAMLAGYIENGRADLAEILFREILEKDNDSWRLLVGGLVTSQRFSDAVSYFMKMPAKCNKTWNTVVLGLVRVGLVKEAHAFLEKYPYRDVITWTNMMMGYFEVGEVESAVRIFESMLSRDVTMWNVMIFGLGENDRGEEGLQVFIRLKESGIFPDEATLTSILTICSSFPSLELGRQSHGQVIKSGLDHYTSVSNAMVAMYARCGNMSAALQEFSFMPCRDTISWNSLIRGFAYHGNGEKALEIFEQMISSDVEPNEITFIAVLTACSHTGLVDQGRYYFNYMRNKCLLEPTGEHITCLVDLLGRFGLIKEAMNFLRELKRDGTEIPASVWGALLGACRIHKNIEVGKIVGERVLEQEPDNSGKYLILVEMYHDCGQKEEARKIWARMKENGVKKQPGCSWIEINDKTDIFLSGGSSHQDFGRICVVLDLLHHEMDREISRSNNTQVQSTGLIRRPHE